MHDVFDICHGPKANLIIISYVDTVVLKLFLLWNMKYEFLIFLIETNS